MKYVVQFMSRETGERSEPFTTDVDRLYKVMEEKRDEVKIDDYILVLASVDDDNDNQMEWVKAPVFTIRNFLGLQGEPEQCPKES